MPSSSANRRPDAVAGTTVNPTSGLTSTSVRAERADRGEHVGHVGRHRPVLPRVVAVQRAGQPAADVVDERRGIRRLPQLRLRCRRFRPSTSARAGGRDVRDPARPVRIVLAVAARGPGSAPAARVTSDLAMASSAHSGFARPDPAEHQRAHRGQTAFRRRQSTLLPRSTCGRGARIRRSWEARLAA